MKTTKILTLVALFHLVILSNGWAADVPQNQQKDPEVTTLYQYGAPLTSSEVNFENLFRNFSRFVENSKEFDLLSYERVGTVNNKRQAKKYVQKNFGPEAAKWGYTSGMGSTSDKGYEYHVKLTIDTFTNRDKPDIDEFISTMSHEYIQKGDEVYKIKFVYGPKTYYHYVFVNPKSHKVLLKGNMFGMDIPMELVKQHEERQKQKE
ncbi:hypothetical protein [Echinicola salinicaeni]|uniref:hypothetical protein n=1 Tax=Echinicola salinicaeni TaxID=2762757 RepID=UPI0016443E5E|nr:hypothetical protein [Echinicola salinicaeni]